jgi:hypothetical protein
MSLDDLAERQRAEFLEQMRHELIPRFRPICEDMPEDVFLDLINRLAQARLRDIERNRRPA